ncbi:MAG: hypothetical protein K9G59_10860 [Caulobacter sp.]|nr:hypothetical protein [Caulobacter sp.]
MIHWAFLALLGVATVGAVARGGSVERQGAALFCSAWVVWLAAEWASGETAPGVWVWVIDATVLFALIGLVWRSPRPWPVYASGLHLLVVTGGIVPWVRQDLHADLHLPLLAALRFAAICAFAIGAWAPPRTHRK